MEIACTETLSTRMNLLELFGIPPDILEECKKYAVGRRRLDDDLFKDDKPPLRLGVYDLDDENLCHDIVKTTCSVPGCGFVADSLIHFESHYNSSHRYACATCKKVLLSPHFLDLHIQESHDSFFAVMAEKKPLYCCYIEDCKDKFKTSVERMEHCLKIHKIPKDFRFDSTKKAQARNKEKVNKNNDHRPMDLDNENSKNIFRLNNNKSKTFSKYTGRKFTNNDSSSSKNIDINGILNDLRDNLPQ